MPGLLADCGRRRVCDDGWLGMPDCNLRSSAFQQDKTKSFLLPWVYSILSIDRLVPHPDSGHGWNNLSGWFGCCPDLLLSCVVCLAKCLLVLIPIEMPAIYYGSKCTLSKMTAVHSQPGIDPDTRGGAAVDHGIQGKATGIATQVQDPFVATVRGQEQSIAALIGIDSRLLSIGTRVCFIINTILNR